ncbi:MAG: hypothetical protein JNL83_21350 [Myxococcales bacterium]|nr:hypothetical protein [Myxococcales bacterium]
MVTADGYVRNIRWPSNQQIQIDYENPEGSPGRAFEGIGAMRDLTAGTPASSSDVVSLHAKLFAEARRAEKTLEL